MQCSEQTQRWATALSRMVFSQHKEAGFQWTGFVCLLSVYAESVQANSSPSKNHSGNLWAAVCSKTVASCAEPVKPWE